jgi:Uncharacterized conserved protein
MKLWRTPWRKLKVLRIISMGFVVVVGENAGIIGKIPKLVKTDKKVTIGELWDV